jgi:hypothetical protein
MAEILIMPNLPGSMSEKISLVWHKTVGDFVRVGDLLVEIKTNLGITEIRSPYEGILLQNANLTELSKANHGILAIIVKEDEDIEEVISSFVNSISQNEKTAQNHTNNALSTDTKIQNTFRFNRKQHYAVLICCLVFILSNILIPFTLGDIYPFTIAPMFRDTPLMYANYRIYSPDGTKLADNSRREIDPTGSPDPFKLRRYYDGNPVGCGVGICPPKTLGDFGIVHQEKLVRKHIAENWPSDLVFPYIEIEQEIIGPIDAQKVGIQKIQRWRINRPTELSNGVK